MMPESGLRPRKKDILEKAARLFLERGYKATSVRDIAFATGIEASSLYSHFPSKESILELLCHECADRFNAAMDAILASAADNDLSRITRVLEFHIDTAFEDPMSGTVFSDEWKNLPEEKKVSYLEKKRNYENKFSGLLAALMEKGLIDKGDPTIKMNTLISSVRWLHHSKKKYTAEEKTAIKKEILDMLTHGLIIKW